MHRLLALLLLALAGPAAAQGLTPVAAVALASADAQAAPAEERPYLRYLMLDAPTAAERRRDWQVVSGHLNALSRSPTITPPPLVLADGSVAAGMALPPEGWETARLVRFRYDDYRFDRRTYDRLAEADFTFHAVLVEDWPGGFDARFGKEFKVGRYRVNAFAPWLAETPRQLAALRGLIEATRSQAPILGARNLIWQTAIQAKRPVGYYGLLGIKDRKDFFALAGFDERVLKQRPELLAVVGSSGVSEQPRRVGRFAAADGGLWRTFDNEKAVEDRNPLVFLDQGFQFDAEEDFLRLPNGLWATGLFKSNGDRQDSAPDFIGYHHQTRSNDGRIHNYLSCLSCHDAQPNRGGLQDIDDWVRAVNTPPPFRLYPADPALRDALRDKYGPNVARAIDRDRQAYTDALRECNGTSTQDHARNLLDVFVAYDTAVGLERAARELGTTPELLQAAITRYGTDERTRSGQSLVLARLALPPERRRPIPIDQWHETVNLAHLVLRGLVQWPDAAKRKALHP